MSAAPAAAKPRVHRTLAFYRRKTGEEVRTKIQGSYGRFKSVTTAWLFAAHRAAATPSEFDLLCSVLVHTDSRHRGNRQKPVKFTPAMLPEDFAKESGYSDEQMRIALAMAIRRGHLVRQCGCQTANGADTCPALNRDDSHYRYRLGDVDWAKEAEESIKAEKNPNAFNKKLYAQDRVDAETGCKEDEIRAETQPTAVGRVKLNRPVRVLSGKRYELPEELPAKAVEVEMAEGTDIDVTLTDGSVLRIAARAPVTKSETHPTAVGRVKPDRPARSAPPPAAADPLVAGLAQRGYPIDPAYAARLRRELGACKDLEFFFSVLTEEEERGRRKRQPLITAGLVAVARNAAGRYPAYRQAQRVPLERDLQRQREMLADSTLTPEEREFVQGAIAGLVEKLGGES